MTRLTELLDIEYPVIQGGMARVATAELVSAVSEAGGLGVLGSAIMTPDELRQEVRKVRLATNKPFGVNLMLQSPYWEENLKVVISEKVPIVTTGAGNPAGFIKELKEAGIKVLPLVGSANQAILLEKAGADAVIAEGKESGGHIGEVTTFVLVRAVCQAVKIPVIAAGGIADEVGFWAALSLGAVGVQMGTRFIASKEAPVSHVYKDIIVSANERSTIEVGKRFKHAIRMWKNALALKLLEAEYEGNERRFEELIRGALKRAVEGDADHGAFMMGQSAGLINEILPVADIVKNVARPGAN